MERARKPDAVYLPNGRRIGGTRAWARELIRAVPNIVKLLGRLAADDRVPPGSKRLAAFVGAYLVSPIDIVPDFIPFIGQTDDLFIAAYALHHLINTAGEAVVREHWDGADEVLDVLLDLVGVVAGLVPRPVRAALRKLGRAQIFKR